MCRGLSKDKLEKGIAVFALNHTQKVCYFCQMHCRMCCHINIGIMQR